MGKTKRKQEFNDDRSAKRKVTTDLNDATLLLPILNDDILSAILFFLKPKEMLSFASTAKSVMKMVTPEHAIRSAVLSRKLKKKKSNNKSAKEDNIDLVFQQLRRGVIHAPSPMRILRLAIGKYCERPGCNATCAMRPQFCLFICRGCSRDSPFFRLEKKPFPWYIRYRVADWRVLQETAVRSYPPYLVSSPFIKPDGEKCGPVITMSDVERMVWQNQTVSEYFDAIGYPDEESARLVEVYDNTLQALAALEKERELKAQIAKDIRHQKALQAERNRAVKKQKVLTIINTVKDMLDDKWKERAMEMDTNNSVKFPAFTNKVVSNAMAAYVKAPSKATSAKLKEIAKEINAGFQEEEMDVGLGDQAEDTSSRQGLFGS